MKKWVEENLFYNNKLVAKRCRTEWFVKNKCEDSLKKIVDATSFLDSDVLLSQRIWHIINEKYELPKCIVCGNTVTFRFFTHGYSDTCSYKCNQLNPITKEKIKTTNLLKYGNEYGLQNAIVKKKRVNSVFRKFGVSNVSQVDSVKKQKIATCLEHNGVEHPMQSETIREKSKNTIIEKYGVENAQQVISVQTKSKITKFVKYYNKVLLSDKIAEIVIPLFSEEEFLGVGYYDKKYKFKCVKCNDIFEDSLYGNIPRCLECYPIESGTSRAQLEIFNFLNELLPEKVFMNDRVVLNGKELDIYVPSKNIAIEFDGLYWHGELNGNKNKTYHLDKTTECLNNGIFLIHIFENEWFDKQEIVKSVLKSKFGLVSNTLYARKCELREVTHSDASLFYTNNHLQGPCQFSKTYGLYYNNELICATSFGKNRFKKDGSVELIRFCNKLNYSVVGGFARLMKHFIKINKTDKIVTFADKRFSNGDIYIKNGFKMVKNTALNYFYVKSGKLVGRLNFQKHKLKHKLKTFDANLTEWQNMQLNGYDRIWDCGNYKFELLTGE